MVRYCGRRLGGGRWLVMHPNHGSGDPTNISCRSQSSNEMSPNLIPSHFHHLEFPLYKLLEAWRASENRSQLHTLALWSMPGHGRASTLARKMTAHSLGVASSPASKSSIVCLVYLPVN